MSAWLDVLEVFAEAQGMGQRREWLGSTAKIITRTGRTEPLPVAEYHRAWRAKNPERAKAITRAYRARQIAKDREAFLARKREANRRYYQRNAEAMRDRAKRYKAAQAAREVPRAR